jgi:hypothetical protein
MHISCRSIYTSAIQAKVKLVLDLISVFSVYESMRDASRMNATVVLFVVLLFGCFLTSVHCMHYICSYIYFHHFLYKSSLL